MRTCGWLSDCTTRLSGRSPVSRPCLTVTTAAKVPISGVDSRAERPVGQATTTNAHSEAPIGERQRCVSACHGRELHAGLCNMTPISWGRIFGAGTVRRRLTRNRGKSRVPYLKSCSSLYERLATAPVASAFLRSQIFINFGSRANRGLRWSRNPTPFCDDSRVDAIIPCNK